MAWWMNVAMVGLPASDFDLAASLRAVVDVDIRPGDADLWPFTETTYGAVVTILEESRERARQLDRAAAARIEQPATDVLERLMEEGAGELPSRADGIRVSIAGHLCILADAIIADDASETWEALSVDVSEGRVRIWVDDSAGRIGRADVRAIAGLLGTESLGGVLAAGGAVVPSRWNLR